MEPVGYPASAVERAMKVQEVILRAIDGRLKWYQAAEILGLSDRQMRRWRRPAGAPRGQVELEKADNLNLE
ncbi:MAG: hypothetical protein ACREIN_01015 [Candidatus Methylomirabilaceae bacterium]